MTVFSPPIVVSTPPRLIRISPPPDAASASKLASVFDSSLFSESATSTMLFVSAGCSFVRTFRCPSSTLTRTFRPPNNEVVSLTTIVLFGSRRYLDPSIIRTTARPSDIVWTVSPAATHVSFVTSIVSRVAARVIRTSPSNETILAASFGNSLVSSVINQLFRDA